MFIDSHCHLTSAQFDGDRDEVLRRAFDAGVEVVVNPAVDVADSIKAIELAERHPRVFACVGLHPHEASKANDQSLKQIEELSRHEKVVGIGEIGLDYHYDFAPRDVQIAVFKAQIEIAQRRDLPIVIHTRKSIEDTVKAVEESIEQFPQWRSDGEKRRGVYHCFSGSTEDAWKVINARFIVSFPGMITFKMATGAAEIASRIPMRNLLLETDSPYLAPVPLRGKRNEPANIPLIAKRISELQNVSIEDVGVTTTRNSRLFFGLSPAE